MASEIDTSGELAWAMVEASPDALVMVNAEGQIQLVNRQTEVMFGYERSELLGKPVEILMPSHLKAQHESHRGRFSRAPGVRSMGSGMQLSAKRRDDSEFPVEISLSPLPTAGGMRTLAAVRDITDRVMAEAEAELARTRQSQSLHAMGEIRSALMSSEVSMQETLDSVCRWACEIALADEVSYRRLDRDRIQLREIACNAKSGGGPDQGPIAADDQVRSGLAGIATIDNNAPSGPRMVLPVDEGNHLEGVLVVKRNKGAAPFNDHDLLLASGFATSTAAALQLNAARASQQRAELLEDRARIGRDMHDKVIGRLFATGMALQSTSSRITDDASQERILSAVGELDEAILEIRTTIYGLQSQVDWGKGARGEILAAAADHNSSLGFEPRVHLTGPIDLAPRDVVDEALATLREALTNAAKHAKASSVTITVDATTTDLRMAIRDNGVGFNSETTQGGSDLHGNGLPNMKSRAEALGGTYALTSSPGEGVEILWEAPFTALIS